jgi:tetratricopeptide (TPR) repeat protein
MRELRRLVIVAILIALVLPEWIRYAGERRLARLTAAAQLFATRPELAPRRRQLLLRLSGDAERLRTFPGDWRPLNLAGSASFLAGDHDRAATLFLRALENGERPEILLNYGLARQAAGDTPTAEAAFARAVRVSPILAEGIPRRGGS